MQARSAFAWIALAVLASTALAGCLGAGSGPAGEDGAPEPKIPSNRSPNASPDASSRAGHVHDLWGERTARVVVNATYDMKAVVRDVDSDEPVQDWVKPNTCRAGYVATCLGNVEFRPPPPSDGKRFVVPPGTGAIEVQVTWTDPTITGVFLRFRPAYADDIPRDLGAFRRSGQTRVLNASEVNGSWSRFPLNWTDDGHAMLSRWRFTAHAFTNGTEVAASDGTIQVRIDAVRAPGPLPLEPPHPGWYANGSAYLVGTASAKPAERTILPEASATRRPASTPRSTSGCRSRPERRRSSPSTTGRARARSRIRTVSVPRRGCSGTRVRGWTRSAPTSGRRAVRSSGSRSTPR